MNIKHGSVYNYLLATALSCFSTMTIALEFHGYVRTGAGFNSSGGDQVCFQLPGAASKFRLGNECDTYGALKFNEMLSRQEDGSYFKFNSTLAFASEGERDFESHNEAFRELYIEAGGLGEGTAKSIRYWVGKRLIRQDVHITDFFYWDNSGAGAGLENVSLGNIKLSYSLIRNVSDDFSTTPATQVNDRALTTHDLRFYEINSNKQGQLTLGLTYIHGDESQATFDSTNGWQIHLRHDQKPVAGGFNRLVLQMGKAAGANLTRNPDDTASTDDQTFRLTEQFVFQPSTKLSGMFSYLYEHQKNTQVWQSIGVRPIFHLSKHLNIAVETGHDQVIPEGGSHRYLNKLTVAVELVKQPGFFSRPVLRSFVTFADWDNHAATSGEGVAGGPTGVFGDVTQGYTAGVQAEVWW